jgi:hypothetical protein
MKAAASEAKRSSAVVVATIAADSTNKDKLVEDTEGAMNIDIDETA